jgi:hypothetical protein
MTDVGLSVAWREASADALRNMTGDPYWTADDAAYADAAVRVVLDALRNDCGAWLTFEGAVEVDRQLTLLNQTGGAR